MDSFDKAVVVESETGYPACSYLCTGHNSKLFWLHDMQTYSSLHDEVR